MMKKGKFMTKLLETCINNYILLSFLLLRFVSVFFVQTHYVADEYWQSLEVAHHFVFGYGYLTWEWRESAIRSCLYPSLFAFLYQTLRVLGLDYRNLLIVFPRIVQAIITALGDWHTVKLSGKLDASSSAVRWTFLSSLTSWFMFYCGSRTIINTVETALTAIALYHFPWRRTRKRRKRSLIWFSALSALTFVIRPTSAILWAPLALFLLKRSHNKVKLFFTFVFVGFVILLVSTICDRIFYKRWVFTLWNFFYFNVLSGASAFYGIHAWHWYFTQGFPVIMTTHLVPFLLFLKNGWKSTPALLIFWQIFIYSWISHKEFRFIMPVLPLAFCAVGKYLSTVEKQNRLWNAKNLFIIMLTTNFGLSIFFGRFWNFGPLQAADQLSKQLESGSTNSSVFFLMPCHSLPLYSHLHLNVETRFLTCDPNLKQIDSYIDEADRFYQNKALFIRNEISNLSSYDVIVIYESLVEDLVDFFNFNNYSRSRTVYNFGDFDERRGIYFHIYCK